MRTAMIKHSRPRMTSRPRLVWIAKSCTVIPDQRVVFSRGRTYVKSKHGELR